MAQVHVVKKIRVGSSVFFGDMPGYEAHDVDYVCLLDRPLVPGRQVMNMKRRTAGVLCDYFLMVDTAKEEMLRRTLEADEPLRAGKFLAPELATHLGMAVDDLRLLDTLFTRMDEKHRYEYVIYQAYLANGSWQLSESQRAEAWKAYREGRGMGDDE